MKVTRVLFAAAFTATCFFANAASMVSVECTQVDAKTFHINATGSEGPVADALINYDVKNTEGRTLASGSGSNINFDETTLAKGEAYSITIYTLADGNIQTQTITRHAGVK